MLIIMNQKNEKSWIHQQISQTIFLLKPKEQGGSKEIEEWNVFFFFNFVSLFPIVYCNGTFKYQNIYLISLNISSIFFLAYQS